MKTLLLLMTLAAFPALAISTDGTSHSIENLSALAETLGINPLSICDNGYVNPETGFLEAYCTKTCDELRAKLSG